MLRKSCRYMHFIHTVVPSDIVCQLTKNKLRRLHTCILIYIIQSLSSLLLRDMNFIVHFPFNTSSFLLFPHCHIAFQHFLDTMAFQLACPFIKWVRILSAKDLEWLFQKTKLEEDFHYTRSNVVCYRFSPSPKRELEILQTLTNNTIQTKDCAPGFIRPWPYITIYVFFLPCVVFGRGRGITMKFIIFVYSTNTLFNIRLVGKSLTHCLRVLIKNYFIVWLRSY